MTSLAAAYLRVARLRAAERQFAVELLTSPLRIRCLAEPRHRVAREFWARREAIRVAMVELHAALDGQQVGIVRQVAA